MNYVWPFRVSALKTAEGKREEKRIYLWHILGWLSSCSWAATVTFLRTPDSSDPVSGFRQKTGRGSGGQKWSAPQINIKEATQHTLLSCVFTVSRLELHFILSWQTQMPTPAWFRESRDTCPASHLPLDASTEPFNDTEPCIRQPLALGPTLFLPHGCRVKTPVAPVGDTETPVPPAAGTTWPDSSARHQVLLRQTQVSSAAGTEALQHTHTPQNLRLWRRPIRKSFKKIDWPRTYTRENWTIAARHCQLEHTL